MTKIQIAPETGKNNNTLKNNNLAFISCFGMSFAIKSKMSKRKEAKMRYITYFPLENLQNNTTNLQRYFVECPNKEYKNFNEMDPKTNISSFEKNLFIDIELPGFTKDSLKIFVKDGHLFVEGNKSIPENRKDVKYLKNEIVYGEFKKKFAISKNIDVNNVKAKFENGILNITLTQKEEEVKKDFQIEVN